MARWGIMLVGLVFFIITTLLSIGLNHSMIKSIVLNGANTIGMVLLLVGVGLIGLKQKTSLSKTVSTFAFIAGGAVLVQYFMTTSQIITLAHGQLQ